ncbi:MAG: hypothetical protein AABY22_17140 [Nanoarchaeota archaeon]
MAKQSTKNLKLEELLDQVYDNALEDRERAIGLYDDLHEELGGQLTNHAAAGMIISKYIERLNKSNDQLIKLAEMIQFEKLENLKRTSKIVSDEEKENLFNMIKDNVEAEYIDE